jgi:hypothetical protein
MQICDEDDKSFRFSKSWNTGGMKLTGKNRSTRGKTCPSATLPTTNPTRTDPGSNPGLRGERPATNSLSHGTALPSYLSPGIVTDVLGNMDTTNYLLQGRWCLSLRHDILKR